MKILVTGSKGQLGSEFRFLAQTSSYQFTFTDTDKLDITNTEGIQLFIENNPIDIILNCAAYTAVDNAEDDENLAYKINHLGVRNLVNICQEKDIKLIHFSTDYVFDGSKSSPYKESDRVSPQGVYGKSKLAGEKEVLQSNLSAIVVRTSWLYSRFGHNFVKSMLDLGESRKELNIVFDQVGTPTNAADLAEAILRCISMPLVWQNKQEIYHFSNEGVASWYDFTIEIFKKYKIDCIVNPILSEAYPTKAKRPHFSVLDKSKFKQDFDYDIRYWKHTFKGTDFNI